MPSATPLQSLVEKLRARGPTEVPGISWSASASPFYKMVPEPAPVLPYVVIDVPPSEVDHSLENDDGQGSYTEMFKPTFSAVGLTADIETVVAPWSATGLCRLLDRYANAPYLLNGTGFEVINLVRLNYALDQLEDERFEGYKRVWVAKADYELIISALYPARATS